MGYHVCLDSLSCQNTPQGHPIFHPCSLFSKQDILPRRLQNLALAPPLWFVYMYIRPCHFTFTLSHRFCNKRTGGNKEQIWYCLQKWFLQTKYGIVSTAVESNVGDQRSLGYDPWNIQSKGINETIERKNVRSSQLPNPNTFYVSGAQNVKKQDICPNTPGIYHEKGGLKNHNTVYFHVGSDSAVIQSLWQLCSPGTYCWSLSWHQLEVH